MFHLCEKYFILTHFFAESVTTGFIHITPSGQLVQRNSQSRFVSGLFLFIPISKRRLLSYNSQWTHKLYTLFIDRTLKDGSSSSKNSLLNRTHLHTLSEVQYMNDGYENDKKNTNTQINPFSIEC